MNAQDIMTTNVVSIGPDETLASAMDVLAELDVRHLPVVDQDELVGMLSDRDLREAGVFRVAEDEESLAALRRAPVGEAMSADVVSINPATTVPEIIELMLDQKVGALPVVDEHTNNLVGIVSYIDVLRAAADALGE